MIDHPFQEVEISSLRDELMHVRESLSVSSLERDDAGEILDERQNKYARLFHLFIFRKIRRPPFVCLLQG